jgi:hypothetical protein
MGTLTRSSSYSTPVEDLSSELLDVVSVDRDWSEGYPDSWDWLKVPVCPWCGGSKQDEDSYDWTCPTHGCSNYGEQIEDDLDGGPMMNYAYPLSDRRSYDLEDAVLIAHLPLVIVERGEGYGYERETTYELALSGGGMDLSWEICEAFMLLGYLPPVHFASLPSMAGRGALSGAGKTDRRKISKRDRWIVAGCRRSFEVQRRYAEARHESATRNLDHIMGVK